jgi:hypothetical protein
MANRLSDEEVLAQIEAARAQAAVDTEVRAKSARYDRKTRRIMVNLTNGALFGFPADMGQGLQGASPEELAAVEVSPSGLGLHWERLDADLSVPALLQGMFGTKAWMRELARAGGSARSEAKANAARKNGLKGGRPRKQVDSTIKSQV